MSETETKAVGLKAQRSGLSDPSWHVTIDNKEVSPERQDSGDSVGEETHTHPFLLKKILFVEIET